MRHAGFCGSAMPVLFIGLKPDDVAGTNFFYPVTFPLYPAAPGGYDQGLAQWMGMPGGSGTGLEGNAGGCPAPCLVGRK